MDNNWYCEAGSWWYEASVGSSVRQQEVMSTWQQYTDDNIKQ